MTDNLIERLRGYGDGNNDLMDAAADRIEQLEKGFRNILTLDDSILMKMIARACLTGAIDKDGKYCFVPPFALEKKDD